MLKKILSYSPHIFALLFIMAFAAFAWTEPTVAPPGGNVPAPINIGSTGQSKAGGLILNTGGAPNGLIVDQGNVGIGMTTPQAKLDVVGNIIASVPTADTHVATKGYVDALVGAAVLPTYVIRSTAAAYNGLLGFRVGANDKCQAEYGENAIMFGTQHINCYTSGTCILEYRITESSWFDGTQNTPRKDTEDYYGAPYGWAGIRNCFGWDTSSPVPAEGRAVAGNGLDSGMGCNVILPIACAIPK